MINEICINCDSCVRIKHTQALVCIDSPESFYVEETASCLDWKPRRDLCEEERTIDNNG